MMLPLLKKVGDLDYVWQGTMEINDELLASMGVITATENGYVVKLIDC